MNFHLVVYVDDLKRVLFDTSSEVLCETIAQYDTLVPEPLNRELPDRISRVAAVQKWKARKRTFVESFPPGTVLFLHYNACVHTPPLDSMKQACIKQLVQ